jgi:N-acetylneuraminic acid mutarotase
MAGKNMYLIGGCMNGREYSNLQMYRLDMHSLNWDLVGTKGGDDIPPGSIDEHTAILEGNQIIIFGGFEDGSRVNNVHTFDVETLTWSSI